MSAADLGLVVLTVAAMVALVAVVAATAVLVRTARVLRITVDELATDLEATRLAMVRADAEMRHLDAAVVQATDLAADLEASSVVVRRVVVRPLVRLSAFWRGLGRALARLVGLDRVGRRRRRRRGSAGMGDTGRGGYRR
jgi:hypothetical protein